MSGYPGYPTQGPQGGMPQGYPGQSPYPAAPTPYPPQPPMGGYPTQQPMGYAPQPVGGYPPVTGYPPVSGYPGGAPPTSGYPGAPTPMGQGGFPNAVPPSGYAPIMANPYAGQPGVATSATPVMAQGITGQAMPTQGLETYSISVACRKLKDKDVFSKSDPVCVLQQQVDVNWQELGRTEQIKNNLNPNWQKKFAVDKRPGQQVRLMFCVYDWDDSSNKLKHHDFLARMEVSLDTILMAPGQQYVYVIKDGPSKGGQFILTAERVSSDKNVAKIQLGARNLDKKDTFGKSDPYFVISKMSGQGRLAPVIKSEVVQNSLKPSWSPFSMSVRKLCNGDYNATLRVDIYDFDANSEHDLIGSFNTNLKELSTAISSNKIFYVMNPKKQGKKGYRNSGEVFVKDFALWEAPAFQDLA